MAFDIHERVFDEDGEYEERTVDRYCQELMELFAASPEGQELIRQGKAIGWADTFMTYGIDYFRATPADMSPQEVEEIVFDVFPRKLSAEPEAGEDIVRELRSFWTFLQREFHLANAAASLRLLTPAAERLLVREMGNPANYGMAKSFVMQGRARGFDMTTQEGLDTFMAVYNAELASGVGSPLPLPPLFPPPFDLESFGMPGSHPHRANKASAARRKMARNSRRKNRKKK